MTHREHTLRCFARCAMAQPQDGLRPWTLAVHMAVSAAMWVSLISAGYAFFCWVL